MIAVLANMSEIDVEKITRKIARYLFDLPQERDTDTEFSHAEQTVGTYIFADAYFVRERTR